MGIMTVGDKLRQARVKSGLQVIEIEKKTGIESHFLLAMELDQFSLLPADDITYCIEKFAKAVGLDPEPILKQYEEELITKPTNAFDNVNNDDIDDGVSNINTDDLFSEPIRKSRRSRHRPKKSLSFFKLILLFGLFFVFFLTTYYFYPKIQTYFAKPSKKSIEAFKPQKEIKEEKREEEPVKEVPQTTILVEGEGNQLTAKVTTSKTPITVSFQLEGAEKSWVAVTNSDLGEGGILLTADNPSYQATLVEGTASALLSLGVSKGVSVKINDELLNIADLVTGDVTTINLEFSSAQP